IDVETDKVVLELPAPASGALVEILKGDGSTVAGQEVIAIIDTEAKAAGAAATAASETAKPAAPSPASAPSAAPAATPAPVSPPHSTASVTAMPAARKLMADKGVATADVAGTGRGG